MRLPQAALAGAAPFFRVDSFVTLRSRGADQPNAILAAFSEH